ncbi:MAG: cytochrome c [Pseudomonadota bacterium]
MGRASLIVIVLAAVVAGAAWALTQPRTLDIARIEAIVPDLARGERAFHAAGCASCHRAPDAASGGSPVLAGGRSFETPYGTFVAPNISQDSTHGIGGWSVEDIVNSVMMGTSPDGRHYYPAFPYGSYAKADLADVVSLAAYLQTLPADPTPNRSHDLAFPFSIRAALGGWKWLYLDPAPVIEISDSAELARGRDLAEGLGHCAECHGPRTALGGLDTARWLAGAPNPSGRGTIPNITPAKLDWSEAEIAAYLKDGFTPDFDVAGGTMGPVIENFARLSDADRQAVAKYLKAVPPVE